MNIFPIDHLCHEWIDSVLFKISVNFSTADLIKHGTFMDFEPDFVIQFYH